MPTSSQLDTSRNTLLANLQTLKNNPLAYETAILALLSLIADNIGAGGGGASGSVSLQDGTTASNKLAIAADGSLRAVVSDTLSKAATSSIAFSASTTSAPFTIANRLALVFIPVIAGSPTLTLQVSLDGGTTWANTTVIGTTSATEATVIESDALARVSGAFGLTNAFRFVSSASITASLSLRSIVQ